MIYLREATTEDRDLLYEWANDPETRRSAFATEPINYEDHCKWFERIVADELERQYIMMNDDIAVGQVRLTLDDDAAEIDYSIAPEKRGLGYGNIIISMIKDKVHNELPQINRLIAKVKPKNIASIYCFEKNEFVESYYQLEYDMRYYRQPNPTEKGTSDYRGGCKGSFF